MLPPAEEQPALELAENSSPVTLQSPVVKPIVVSFDEESDSESCSGTPHKSHSKEQQNSLSLQSSGKSNKKCRLVSLKNNVDKQNLENTDLGFHVKTLAEIRKEKSKNNGQSNTDVSKNSALVELKEASTETDGDLRVKRSSRLPRNNKDSEHSTNSLDKVKILTREELRELKNQKNKSAFELQEDAKTEHKNNPRKQIEGKVMPVSIKRNPNVKLSENDLANVRVKSLEEIRAEKCMQQSADSSTPKKDEQGDLNNFTAAETPTDGSTKRKSSVDLSNVSKKSRIEQADSSMDAPGVPSLKDIDGGSSPTLPKSDKEIPVVKVTTTTSRKGMSVDDEDLDFLLGGTTDLVDETVELQDDDVLRELDEAINST